MKQSIIAFYRRKSYIIYVNESKKRLHKFPASHITYALAVYYFTQGHFLYLGFAHFNYSVEVDVSNGTRSCFKVISSFLEAIVKMCEKGPLMWLEYRIEGK